MTVLTVRPRDVVGEQDWPWILIDATSGEIWGDYPNEADARLALAQAVDHGEALADA